MLCGYCSRLYNHEETIFKPRNVLLAVMDFKKVLQICYDFSTTNNGTIQSYPAGSCKDQLDIRSRTARTSIHIEKVQPGVWMAEQALWMVEMTQNAVGKNFNQNRQMVYTEEHLLEYLSSNWEIEIANISPQINIAIVPQLNVESTGSTVTRLADRMTG